MKRRASASAEAAVRARREGGRVEKGVGWGRKEGRENRQNIRVAIWDVLWGVDLWDVLCQGF